MLPAANMIKYVDLVVQVVGIAKIPLLAKDLDGLRVWYSKVTKWYFSVLNTSDDFHAELNCYCTSPSSCTGT